MRMIAVGLLATMVLAVTRPAHAEDESWDAWRAVLSDFFMGPEVREEFSWTGALEPGRTLEIKGVNGAVVAEPAPGSTVVVQATKRGRRSRPQDVRVEVVEHAAGVTLCAVYPSAATAPNVCAPGTAGRMSTRNNDVSVDFRVKVPATVRFTARTVNGAVKAAGLHADAEGYTVNGAVSLETQGQVRAETVNGSIHATLGRSAEALRFETVNGNIVVELPPGTNAALDAETTNGRIRSDLPVAVATQTRTRLVGSIGAGGHPLALETVNGSIHLRRR